MRGSEIRPGERVKDVHFTDDTLAVDLIDGRTITVLPWLGTQDCSTPRRNSAGTGRSAAPGSESNGRMWMRTSALRACCAEPPPRLSPPALM
jgi:hypothetical protein